MGIFFLVFLASTFLFLLMIFFHYKNKNYFESKGIPYQGNGTIRLIFNSFKGIGLLEDINIQYNKLKKENVKVAGTKDFGMTSLVITDVELLKSIFVKDFDHFADRRAFNVAQKDYLFKKMLFSLKGEPWKQLRSKLSPTFTTGKIKKMVSMFEQSGKKLVKFVEDEMSKSNDGEIDLSEGYSKFTMDTIASAACGYDSKAFDQKEPSLFEKMGKEMQLNFGGAQIFKIILMVLSPKFADFLGLSFFPMKVQDFFSGAIKSSINHRVANNEKRNDFIQLMMEAREGKLKTEESELEAFEKDAVIKTKDGEGSQVNTADLLDDDGIVANCVLFILAGFDTTQSLLLFCAYALALYPEVQDKLREEIDSVLEENDGELNYESLSKMTYLDMVINETLRLYPPAAATDRGCTIDWKVPGTDFVLKTGQGIVVPIFGIHRDKDFYPEPEQFIPERFSAENKHKINPYTFLPFGQGPRNCIGMRFALTEVKVAIANLVHSFKIEPSKKTLIPMKFSNASSLKPEGGMFLALNKIQH